LTYDILHGASLTIIRFISKSYYNDEAGSKPRRTPFLLQVQTLHMRLEAVLQVESTGSFVEQQDDRHVADCQTLGDTIRHNKIQRRKKEGRNEKGALEALTLTRKQASRVPARPLPPPQ
jgi:hypothetical protein